MPPTVQAYPILQGLLAGIVLGLSIASPPGPINATMARRVSFSRSWILGFLVGLGAATADGIFLLLTYLGWTVIISGSRDIMGFVYILGGCAMISYASLMIIRFVRKRGYFMTGRSGDRFSQRIKGWEEGFSYFIGLSLGLSNPYQIAWWLTVGLASISSFGPVVAIGFFAGIIMWLLAYTTGLSLGSSRLASFESIALYASSLALFAFGAWFIYNAFQLLQQL